MKRFTILRTLFFLLFITIPGLCWGAGNALIVHDGTAGFNQTITTNLTTHLTTAGYIVSTSVGVPAGDLSGNAQIWDLRYNNTTPLTASDITAYVTYLAGGGSLFVMGENTFFLTRDNSIIALISAAGGGNISLTSANNAQTVRSPFTGPNAITTMTFLAGAGTASPGTGALITKGSNNIGIAIVFSPGSMSNAPTGTLIVIFDVNFLDPGSGGDANSQLFTDNLIAYLAAPVPIPSASAVDLFWRHATGEAWIWRMNGTSISSQASLGTVDLNWEIKGAADFDGDGQKDLIWRNKVSGQVYLWLMNGTTIASQGSLGTFGLDWVIQRVADFNGDGRADILWRNATSGQVYLWLMNGTTIASQGSLGAFGSDWLIQGVADFNGDGRADILWRNATSGQVYLWLMNGTTIASQASLGAFGSDWVFQGVADFNGDGRADILWRNATSGQVYLWLMNGTTIASQASLGAFGSDWVFQGVADFNGDGRADILWRNATSGQVYLWLMNGTTIASQASLGAFGSDWVFQGVADFNGDGRADILWRNATSGQVYLWLMNGITNRTEGSPETVSDNRWTMVPLN